MIKVGDKAQFKVIKVSKDERKLGLSVRALKEKAESKEIAKEKVVRKAVVAAPKKKVSVAPKKKETKRVAESTSGIKSALQQALMDHAERMKDDSKPVKKDKKEEK